MARAPVSAVSGDELKLASVSKQCAPAEGRGAVMQGIAKVGCTGELEQVSLLLSSRRTQEVSLEMSLLLTREPECNGLIKRAGRGGPDKRRHTWHF